MPLSLPIDSPAIPFTNRTLALLIAPSRQDTLHELTGSGTAGTGAGLPFALGLHVVDFQLANLLRAGVRDVILLQPEEAGRDLQDHLRQVWQPVFNHLACLSGPVLSRFGFDLPVLRRCLALIKAIDPQDLLLAPADEIGDPDLAAMIAAHRRAAATVTIEAPSGEDPSARLRDWLPALAEGRTVQAGAMLFDWPWLRDGLPAGRIVEGNLPQHVIDRVAADGMAQVWNAGGARPYRRCLDSLDSFRVTWLDFLSGEMPPLRLPAPVGQSRVTPFPQTNVRDSVIMPGASVGARASVSRAIIAPGAHVPDGMVIGQDPETDARQFRLTRGGTVLVTAEVLAALA